MLSDRIPAVVLAVSLAGVLLATLAPIGAPADTSSWGCVFCGDRALADLVVNVVLFTPLGIGLALSGAGFVRATVGGFLLSTLVESLQIPLPARDASLGDIIANTLGTAVGAGVALLAPRWAAPGRIAARWLTLSWAVVTIGMLWLTGWLLAPSLPHTTYYGQWTPNLGHLEWYRGRVLEVTVDGIPVPSRRAPDSDRLRRSLEEGRPIDIGLTAGPPTTNLASIFSVYDHRRHEIVLVGPDGGDLVFRYRTRAVQFRLDQPDLRLRGAMTGATRGDSLVVSVARDASGYCMSLDASLECGLGYTVGDGWALLLYAETFPAWLKQSLRLAWLAAMLAPIGFWARRVSDLLVACGLAAAALVLVPLLTDLLSTPWTGWVAAAAGVAIGRGARFACPALARSRDTRQAEPTRPS